MLAAILFFFRVSESKPDWETYFAPIIRQIQELENEGIHINGYHFSVTLSNKTQKLYLFQVRVIQFQADNIARADVLRMVAPGHSYFSCPYCTVQVCSPLTSHRNNRAFREFATANQ